MYGRCFYSFDFSSSGRCFSFWFYRIWQMFLVYFVWSGRFSLLLLPYRKDVTGCFFHVWKILLVTFAICESCYWLFFSCLEDVTCYFCHIWQILMVYFTLFLFVITRTKMIFYLLLLLYLKLFGFDSSTVI